MDHSMMNHSMMTTADPHAHHHMNHVMTTADPHAHHHMNHSAMGHGTTADPHAGHNMHNMGGMGGMDHSGHGQGMGHMMMMYFHTGISEVILFEGCVTSSTTGMVLACVLVFACAILYEGIKFLREALLQRYSPHILLQRALASRSDHSNNHSPCDKRDNGGLTSPDDVQIEMSVASRMFSCSHAMQTILHVLQVFISYCLMLVFMTYNVWLCLAVVLGAGVGYFLFGWKRAVVVDANEHCH